jgi:hypothetical protein
MYVYTYSFFCFDIMTLYQVYVLYSVKIQDDYKLGIVKGVEVAFFKELSK